MHTYHTNKIGKISFHNNIKYFSRSKLFKAIIYSKDAVFNIDVFTEDNEYINYSKLPSFLVEVAMMKDISVENLKVAFSKNFENPEYYKTFYINKTIMKNDQVVATDLYYYDENVNTIALGHENDSLDNFVAAYMDEQTIKR